MNFSMKESRTKLTVSRELSTVNRTQIAIRQKPKRLYNIKFVNL